MAISAIAGHDDHFRVGLHVLDRAEERHAVEDGHLEVDEDHVIRMFLGHGESLVGVLARAHLVTLFGQQQCATLAHDLLVIDHQDRPVFHVDLAASTLGQVVQCLSSGSVIVNVVPSPGVLSTAMLPPCPSMIPCVIGQSQSRTLPHVLGREERIEDLPDVLRRNADARVAEHDLDGFAVAIRLRPTGSRPLPARPNRAVDHRGASLRWRSPAGSRRLVASVRHPRGPACAERSKSRADLDRLKPRLMFHQRDRLLQDPVQIVTFLFRAPLAGQIQQLANDRGTAFGLFRDDLQLVLLVRAVRHVFGQDMGEGQDAGQRAVQFVSHAGRQQADGREFFGADDLSLGVLQVARLAFDFLLEFLRSSPAVRAVPS